MPADKKIIPTLDINSFQQLHFSDLISNSRNFSINQEEFIIQKLEETVNTLKLPIPPHRKTVYDFIFVTHGEALRTSGLNKYTLTKQQIFFLPANQITSTPFVASPNLYEIAQNHSPRKKKGFSPIINKLGN